MLHLIYGPEDFLKKQYLKQLAGKSNGQLEYYESVEPDRLKELLEPGLFGDSKIIVLENYLAKIDSDFLEILKDSKQTVVLLEDRLDKRKKETKSLLGDKKIIAAEFTTPTGSDLRKFINDRIKLHKAEFTPKGLEALVEVLEESVGDYGGPQWNLWGVDNELQKLATYAGNKPIDENTVNDLLALDYQPEVWSIINAIAEKDKTRALAGIERFLAIAEGADEKTKIIQLNALIADQARNLLIIKDLLDKRLSDDQILAKTLWKSGRLYVLKRLASRFSNQGLLETLAKLEALDRELKTSGLPGRVLLDLIVVQMA